MKNYLIILTCIFLLSCEQDSYWVTNSSVHLKTDRGTIVFRGQAKDSLLTSIKELSGKQRHELTFINARKEDLKHIPPPEIVELDSTAKQNFMNGEFREVIISTNPILPEDYLTASKRDNEKYFAVSIVTDTSGSNYFWKSYLLSK